VARTVAIVGTRGYPSYYGGFETAVRKLSPYLADEGWRVTVYGREGAVEANDPEVDDRIESILTLGIDSRSLSTLSYGGTACLDVARKRPDVALIMNVANGYWLPLLRARGIATVMNVDGIEWERSKWNRLAKLVFRGGAWLSSRFADCLIVDAEAIGQVWRKLYGRDGTFIPYGADVPNPLPLQDGLSHRGYILFVARLVPENTVEAFLDAVADLSLRHQVVIVGSSGYGGDLECRVANLAQSGESVRWLGHLSDERRLLSLWQHCGVYFHGHSVGGTNPALVQAMACGAPIVARDTPYSREVLGDTGTFCDPDPQSIRDALEAVMNGSDFPFCGKGRAEAKYSWAQVCSSYDRLLKQLLQRKGTHTALSSLVEFAIHYTRTRVDASRPSASTVGDTDGKLGQPF
jgi:glycosyltransferase involved in cell wall biosynthesis